MVSKCNDIKSISSRGGSRAAATFKMECFVIIVNGWKPLTIITKHSILDVAATLDLPLSSKNTIICLCIQSSRINQILALWSAEVRVFLSPIRKFNHFYLNFWRKYPPVCCVVSANLSRLLYTFYIPIHHMYKWRWVNFCHIYSKQYNSNMKLMFYITHTGAFLTLLLLIDTTH